MSNVKILFPPHFYLQLNVFNKKKVLYLYKHKKLGINSFEAHSKSLNFFLNVKPRQNGPPAPTYDRCCLDSRKHKNKY